MNPILQTATEYVGAGLSVIPVRVDGSKAPVFTGWREFSTRRPAEAELARWFGRGNVAIGIPGGPASGNLAVLDFEAYAAFDSWGRCLTHEDRDLLARSPIVYTPSGGVHVYLRLVESVRGCKLARTAAGECLIEVRGHGHFVVAPGSPAKTHATGKLYRLVKRGWLDGGSFEPISMEAYYQFQLYAAGLNEYRKPQAREIVGDRATGEVGERPGDHFNQRVAWSDILKPHGWKIFSSSDAATFWTRPGKASGISASTGFCTGESGRDLLYVFSTSASPFEAEVSYSRFGAYALLNHHGDWRAATRALGTAGYGKPLPRFKWKGARI